MAVRSSEHYWIECDGIRCAEATSDDSDSMEGAIDEALGYDWENINGRYLCPKCAKKGQT
jgi:hypothetical protein